MSETKRFIELCLSGDAGPEDADDFVDQWHESKSPRSLAEFLGLTKDEYALWVEQPKLIRYILFARKRDVPLAAVLEQEATLKAAARAASAAEAREVLAWLKKTKRVR